MGHRLGAEIAGAALGGVVFMAGWGIAKLITAPFRGTHRGICNQLQDSNSRMTEHTVIREQRAFFIQGRVDNNVIDMGEVEEFDQYDVNNLVEGDRRWQAGASRRAATASVNAAFAQAYEKQIQDDGGYPWQKQARVDAEKERRAQLRKDHGLIGSLFAK
jgi:hypothetical protein